MALTRAQVETIVLRRVAGIFEAAELDHTTHNGTNADLDDPIGWAVRRLGGSTADPTAVADGDLAGLAVADHDKLFDLAEYRALETGHTALLDLVSLTSGPRTEHLSDLAAGLGRKLERMEARLKAQGLGVGVATLSAGVLALDFAEKSE